MSNDYFQFKRFRVGQERCAMKVTTDACIQGAWTPVLPHVRRVLDIGTGTGLLSLMVAQRSREVTIDAIEIDEAAAGQARDNVEASPWGSSVKVINADVRNHPVQPGYDLIISNPPFFSNSLLSNEATRDNARHTLQLSFADLLSAIKSNLAHDGYASVMLPLPEYELLKTQAIATGLYEAANLCVRHTAQATVKRVVGIFSTNSPSFAQEEELIIMDDGQYSQAFVELLSPFYLNL